MVRHMTRWRLSFTVQAVDLAIIIAVGLLDYMALNDLSPFVPPSYVSLSVMVAVISHFSFARANLYDIETLFDEIAALRLILARWTVIFLGLAAFAALAHAQDSYSRLWFVGFYVVGLAGLLANRTFVALAVRRAVRRGYVTRSVVVYGDNELAGTMAARLANNRSGVRIVAVFDDTEEPAGAAGPRFGGLNDLLDYTKHHPVDMVVISLPLTESDRIETAIRALRHQPLNIRVLPGLLGLDRMSLIRTGRTELPGVHLIPVADRPISDVALLVKGSIDRIVSAAALVCLLPLFGLVALGIKLSSPGPVFFKQKRIGYKGHEFEIIKFRTMHVSATPHTTLTARNDTRVFGFGSLIRKTSIDELPQLINVLRGDMSLIGPRPHMPEARAAGKLYFEAVNEYAGRHRVKPGLTGWAQVNGWRGPTETITQIERRVEHDLYYIENWSLVLDLMILIRTLFVGFVGRNVF